MLGRKCGESLKIALRAMARLAKAGAMGANGDPLSTPSLSRPFLPIPSR